MSDPNASPNLDIQTPAQWAQSQLEYMGLPVTDGNISFLVSWAAMEGGNWNNTASFNPLNTTLNYNNSHVMSGGNTAGVQAYSSWADGLAATAQTLVGYPSILNALRQGDAMQVNQNGGLGNDLSKWSGGGYTQVGQNSSYGAFQGGTQTTGGGFSTQAPNLSMNDIPGLDAYIRNQLGPAYSWMLDIPGLSQAVEQAVVASPNDPAQIMAKIEQTNWWKTTSVAYRTYLQQRAENPADYSFTTAGSTASQILAQVENEAATRGVQLTADQAQTLATNYMKFGWKPEQLDQAIGSLATNANAGSVDQQLNTIAGQYYQQLSPQALQSWAQNIAGGTQTLQQFQAQMAKNAALKWTGFSDQLSRGMNMVQLTDNIRSDAAKTMEVDPNSIDFINNPMYSKILDYVPPNSPNGVHRVMTDSEMQQYLKSTQPYGYTQGARDSAAQMEQALAQTFGKVG